MKFNYSASQREALTAIKAFIESNKDIFILTGQAGSGKTALIPEINTMAKQVKTLSATNQGLSDLIFNYGLNAHTVYHEFYGTPERSIYGTQNQIQSISVNFLLQTYYSENTIFIIDNAELLPNIDSGNTELQYGSGKVLDDILHVVIGRHNKLIFIGDECGLKPVTDNQSQALQINYFESKGLHAETHILRDHHRVTPNISYYINNLQNTIKNGVGAVYEITDNRHDIFNLDRTNHSELEKMKEIAKKVAISPIGSSMIVANSMKKAQEYNRLIRNFQRKQRFLEKNDLLILTKNIYFEHGNKILPTGSFIWIESIDGDLITHSVKVHHKNIELHFLPVTYWVIVSGKAVKQLKGNLLTNILSTNQSALENNDLVLYIDYLDRHQEEINEYKKQNQKIETDTEHQKHDRRTKEYLEMLKNNLQQKLNQSFIKCSKKELKKLLVKYPECDPKKQCKRIDPYKKTWEQINEDPFYNCIVAKYGYATTAYKTIGNEWENIYVDFENQNGVKSSAIRWAYIALSRSTKRLIVLNKRGIFTDGFKVDKKIASEAKIRQLQQLSKFESVSFGSIHGNKVLLEQLFIHLKMIFQKTGIKYVGIDTAKVANNFVRYYCQLKSGERFELQMYFSHKGWSKANIYIRSEYQEEDLKQIDQFKQQLEKLNPCNN
ncbi:AAA family ATPase [Limosilactobacillus caviae]|uniref:AAA family ATPase n=1 Tax=Limosilactobacillus caviae TaxID=1769424 RepID=UPI003517006F